MKPTHTITYKYIFAEIFEKYSKLGYKLTLIHSDCLGYLDHYNANKHRQDILHAVKGKPGTRPAIQVHT